ncbi:MAG: fibronectin type III domain-containing protein, partial [Armatimonadota bacterium]|nr:fibronectin type III domain-containing protein [Armatimonadota bacterium]
MQFFKLPVLLAFIILFTPRALTAQTLIYPGDAPPTSCGWQILGTNSNENGNGITSSVISDSGALCWRLSDESSTYQCQERNTSLGLLILDTGATVAARVKCESNLSTSSYNLGMALGSIGGMFIAIKTDMVELMDRNYSKKATASFTPDAVGYHIYQMSVKNSTPGDNNTASWNIYRDGASIISWTGKGYQNGYSGFLMGHAGQAGEGVWVFDWVTARNDGAFSPSQWDPTPPPPPDAPVVTFPIAGTAVNSNNPEVLWQGQSHDRYELHITNTNSPTGSIVWDSGEVVSPADSCLIGTLPSGQYYAFVRIRNSAGWSAWSASISFSLEIRVRIIP